MDFYSGEWVDGQYIEPLIIDTNTVSTGEQRGGIIVRPDVTFRLLHWHQGSLVLEDNSAVVLESNHQGSIHVGRGATLTILKHHQGALHVYSGGVVNISPSGSCQGSVHVDGLLINEGSRGGPSSGEGEIRDRSGSQVIQPVTRGNTTYYQW